MAERGDTKSSGPRALPNYRPLESGRFVSNLFGELEGSNRGASDLLEEEGGSPSSLMAQLGVPSVRSMGYALRTHPVRNVRHVTTYIRTGMWDRGRARRRHSTRAATEEATRARRAVAGAGRGDAEARREGRPRDAARRHAAARGPSGTRAEGRHEGRRPRRVALARGPKPRHEGRARRAARRASAAPRATAAAAACASRSSSARPPTSIAADAATHRCAP